MTGNTKKLCEAVYNNLKNEHDIDISTVKDMPSTDEYDLVVIGFWVDKGTANKEAKKQIKQIQNKPIALLGTLGADPKGEHGQKVIEKVKTLPHTSAEYKGVFLCRGKVAEKLTKRIPLLPLPRAIKDKMYESSIQSREPNEEDFQNGTDFLRSILES